MARLTDPFEIIRPDRAHPKRNSPTWIKSLIYTMAAWRSSIYEVGKMPQHLDGCGLADNTIIIVVDSCITGMEFFQHDTWGQGNWPSVISVRVFHS